MQEFASKASRWAGALNQELNCLKSRKLVRIMKITAVILLGACLQLSARGLSQTITLSVKDAPLRTVFKSIEKQTDYDFFFDEELLRTAKRVTVNVNNLPLTQVLDICFKDQPFTYTVSGNTITLVRKKLSVINSLQTENGKPLVDIKGRVLNEKGEPVVGVTIKVKGTDRTTLTDVNGEFYVSETDGNATLILTHVGMEPLEVKINGSKDIVISLKTKVSPLDEVQMIAYGSSTKRFNTGNVTTVKGSEIEKQPINNPLLALQGRVPGLTVVQSNGISGSAVTVRVQGRNNLNASFTGSDPLFVIDNVPYPSQNLLTLQTGSGTSSVLGPRTGDFSAAGSTLAFINPDDIESIEVLKDADATAIYGSRAANGAILITTKKGRSGEPKVDVNFQTGWGTVARKMELLNREQYLEMRHEAKINDKATILSTDYDLNGLWDTTRVTDWQKVLIGGTAKYTRASASISGGNSFTKYIIGGTYSKETTVYPGDFANKKGSVHFNINSATSNNRLQVQLTGSFLADNNGIPGVDFTRFIGLSPVAPALYNDDGTLNWAPNSNGISSWDNPLSYNSNLFENKSSNLVSNGVMSYRVISGLEVKLSLGYNQLQSKQFLASLDGSFRPEDRSSRVRMATFVDNTIKSLIAEPQITYSRNFNKLGKLDVLIGSTFQQSTSDGLALSATGQSSDDLLKNLAAATSIGTQTINSVYKYNAVFGRLNYNFRNRYLINLSARRDGSSRFGSKNLFHDFGAIGLGWIFSEESVIKSTIPFLSFGKLRGSYGVMGNDQIGDYNFMSLYQSTINLIPYQNIRGLEPAGISNPYLQWEETRKLQAGLDLGFISDRFLLSVNYFRNRSNNTLSTVSLPIITGTTRYLDNFSALIQNTGWEFSLRLENIKTKNFTWSTNFNLTIPQNKLKSFPDLSKSSLADYLIIGKPLSIEKSFSYYGIDPQTGGFLLLDSSGKVTPSPNYQSDRISILTTAQKYYGGLSNSFTFKGFQVDFLFQFTKQKGWNFLNIGGIPGRFNTLTILGNQPTTVLDRWQRPDDITNSPRYKSVSGDPISGDWSFRDASFIRLKNVSLSYRFPKKWISKTGLKDVNIFVNGQNLLTITRYKGLDPETQSITTLPPLRVITVGAKLSL